MKLTPVNNKLRNSIRGSIYSNVYRKTFNSTSGKVRWKIDDEIWNPNLESISWMQQRILNNLKDEINTNK